MSRFLLPVDDELDLVLCESWTVPALHRLVVANQQRLAQWEPWAIGEQRIETTQHFNRTALLAWVDGARVPTVIRYRGEIVGSLGARIETYSGTANMGYWLDGAHEGRGIVTRAARAMLSHLFDNIGVARVEIHTATINIRSRALAERLGFTHEGTLRSVMPVGDLRHDDAVYGLLATDPRG